MSAVLAALVVGAATACGGGSGGGEGQGVDVEFTREDGSDASFPAAVHAWCGPFDESNPEVEAVHVLAGELPVDEAPASFWVPTAVRADVERTPQTTLPNGFVYTEPEGASLFVLDDAEHRSNELSSAAEESSGTIDVELAGCEPGDIVRLTFDEIGLGSEAHDNPTMSVEGTVEATIDAPP